MTTALSTFLSPGKILTAHPVPLRLRKEDLQRHVFIAGGTGRGKSKLLELSLRQVITQDVGLTFIDPHGDGTEAILHFLSAAQIDPARVIYLQPGDPEHCFAFDPFANPPAGASPIRRESWLRTTVDRIVRAVLRNIALADQEVMKRLRRWLKNLLIVAGTEVDGSHLGISDALLLTDPSRFEFDAVLNRVAPYLPGDVLADFLKLKHTKGAINQEKWVESTVNCLRDLLSPVIRLIFGQHARSLNLKTVIRERKILLVNLRKTDLLSRDQANIIGGLILNFLLNAAENLAEELAPEHRESHYVFIDEAEHFIGEDLRMGFAELRKFGLCLCLAIQDLSCLRRGELDLVNKVVSQCGLQMTFQQQNPEDIEFLGKAFGYGSLDFTPLLREEMRHDGYDWVSTQSLSVGVNRQQSTSTSTSVTQSKSHSKQQQLARSIQDQVSLALSTTHADGESHSSTTGASRGRNESTSQTDTAGVTEGEGTSEGRSESTQHGTSASANTSTSESQQRRSPDGRITESSATGSARSDSHGTGESHSSSTNHHSGRSASASTGVNEGTSVGTNWSTTNGFNTTDTQGLSQTFGKSFGKTVSNSIGTSVGVAIGESRGTSDAAGESIGLTFQSTPLARHKLVQSETGNLLHSVTDQLSMVMNKLAALPERTVLVKCQGLGTPFLLRVHDIGDPYADLGLVRSPSWRADDLQSFLRSVHDVHSIYFTPTAEGERELERQRLERFLLPRHQVAAPLHLADSQAQTTDLGSERRQTENPFGS